MTLPTGDATRAEAVGDGIAPPSPPNRADRAEDEARRAVEGIGVADRLTPREGPAPDAQGE